MSEEEIFWLDKFEGEAQGNFYVRSDLFKFFEQCEKAGKKVVGIKKPTDWNLCVICEKENKDVNALTSEPERKDE